MITFDSSSLFKDKAALEAAYEAAKPTETADAKAFRLRLERIQRANKVASMEDVVPIDAIVAIRRELLADPVSYRAFAASIMLRLLPDRLTAEDFELSLEPCPHCHTLPNLKRENGLYYAECSNGVDCETWPITRNHSSPEEASLAWNTRRFRSR